MTTIGKTYKAKLPTYWLTISDFFLVLLVLIIEVFATVSPSWTQYLSDWDFRIPLKKKINDLRFTPYEKFMDKLRGLRIIAENNPLYDTLQLSTAYWVFDLQK